MKKGSHQSPEAKEKNRLAHLGKTASAETRALLSKQREGDNNPMKQEGAKLKHSIRMKENNPMFNQESRDKLSKTRSEMTLSEDHKEKIRVSTKEALADPDVRKRMSESHEGVERPQWVRDKISAGKKDKPKSEDHKRKLSEGRIGKYTGEDNPFFGKTHTDETKELLKGPKTKEQRIKMSCSRRGISVDEFTGFVRFEPYCEKFNETLKTKVRHHFGNKCVLCGKPARHNLTKKGKLWDLSVHHVYIEKLACCETKIEEMDTLRRRFPRGVARFGEPEFSEEEIMYIRMMVPLCLECHCKVGKEPSLIAYEKSKYRKFFTELIISKFNCKCYSTDEESKTVQKNK